MSAYKGYPDLEEQSIPERTQSIRKVVLMNMQLGISVDQLLQATEEALAKEQYELAHGIELAIKEFQNNPQLGLF